MASTRTPKSKVDPQDGITPVYAPNLPSQIWMVPVAIQLQVLRFASLLRPPFGVAA